MGAGGQGARCSVRERGHKWAYLYGFVRPESGEAYWLILPTVNAELF